MSNDQYRIAALYQFVAIKNPHLLQAQLLQLLKELDIKGTLLIAHEGINGTVTGLPHAIDTMLEHLSHDGRFNQLSCKFSTANDMPFLRSCVKLKKEIVALGVEGINPTEVGWSICQT